MPIRCRTVTSGLAASSITAALGPQIAWSQTMSESPDLILGSGRITTLDLANPDVQAVAISDGRIKSAGSDDGIMRLAGSETKVIDLGGRRVIRGLSIRLDTDHHAEAILFGLAEI